MTDADLSVRRREPDFSASSRAPIETSRRTLGLRKRRRTPGSGVDKRVSEIEPPEGPPPGVPSRLLPSRRVRRAAGRTSSTHVRSILWQLIGVPGLHGGANMRDHDVARRATHLREGSQREIVAVSRPTHGPRSGLLLSAPHVHDTTRRHDIQIRQSSRSTLVQLGLREFPNDESSRQCKCRRIPDFQWGHRKLLPLARRLSTVRVVAESKPSLACRKRSGARLQGRGDEMRQSHRHIGDGRGCR
jgi:hypothetical protein